MLGHLLEYAVTLAAELSDFDASAYTAWLSGKIGVAAEDVSLEVVGASVEVTARVVFTGDAAESRAGAAAAQLNAMDAEQISEEVGQTVEAVTTASVVAQVVAAPDTPPHVPSEQPRDTQLAVRGGAHRRRGLDARRPAA